MHFAGPPPGAPPGVQQGQTPISTYMMGALIITALSGIMMIVDDFAGGYWRNEYTEGWFWLSAWSGWGPLIIIPMALTMFYMAYWSSSAMRDPSIITVSQLKRFFMFSLVIGGLSMVFGIVFAAIMIIDDYNDWWFDVGFYGGLIGGFLAALIFYQAKKQAEAMGLRPS